MRFAVGALVAAAVAASLSACGGHSPGTPGGKTPGDTLTIYSSLPLRGPQAAVAESMVGGEKLALAETGGTIGGLTVKFVSLDSSSGDAGIDPTVAALNARAAIRDASTIGYIGELDYDASAISIPLLNAGGVAQVSPGAAYAGFTARAPGVPAGEPDLWYPSGVRTFARVVPSATQEAVVQATWQAAQGCRITLIVTDGSPAATAFGAAAKDALKAAGVTSQGPWKGDATNPYAGAPPTALFAEPNCVLVTGSDDPVGMWNTLHRQLPKALLFAPAGLLTADAVAALDPGAQAATRVTRPVVGAREQPATADAVEARYRKAFGRAPEPEMLLGYEAMKVILEAVRLAGDGAQSRTAVARALHRVRRPSSTLGTYAIRADGDTTLARFGGWTVSGGTLRFARVLDAGV